MGGSDNDFGAYAYVHAEAWNVYAEAWKICANKRSGRIKNS
jgi:hypothetical protein